MCFVLLEAPLLQHSCGQQQTVSDTGSSENCPVRWREELDGMSGDPCMGKTLQLVCRLPLTACTADVLCQCRPRAPACNNMPNLIFWLESLLTPSDFHVWILPRCGSGCPKTMTGFLDLITLDLNNDCQKE